MIDGLIQVKRGQYKTNPEASGCLRSGAAKYGHRPRFSWAGN